MNKPIINIISKTPYQGTFGAQRRCDIHTGFDNYCNVNEPVFAIEKGKVINIPYFTGEKADSKWWNETKAILIEGHSGIILYGELDPLVKIDDFIEEGQLIGKVLTVLKEDKGLPMTMLHIELYKHGYRGDGEWWYTGQDKPKYLENIEDILFNIYGMKYLKYINEIFTTTGDIFSIQEDGTFVFNETLFRGLFANINYDIIDITYNPIKIHPLNIEIHAEFYSNGGHNYERLAKVQKTLTDQLEKLDDTFSIIFNGDALKISVESDMLTGYEVIDNK